MSWPSRIAARGETRSQFHPVIDIAPTIFAAAGVAAPSAVNGVAQQPIDGTSLAYTFEAGGKSAPGRHEIQYFEVLGNRGIYKDGWFANTTPKRLPWSPQRRYGRTSGDFGWELCDLRSDFAQARDLSGRHPAKLKELTDLWWAEARRNKVLPIMESIAADRFGAGGEASGVNRPHSVFWGPLAMDEGAAPSLRSRSFTIKAELEVPADPRGVILATGNAFGGWSFYFDGKQVVAFESFSQQPAHQYRVSAPAPRAGRTTVQFDFAYDGGGTGRGGTMRISIDGVDAASGRVERTGTLPQNSEQFSIGFDGGALVSPDYAADSRFNGAIGRVDVILR